MIPFNKPYLCGNELGYIAQAHAKGHWRVMAALLGSAKAGWSNAPVVVWLC